MFESVKVANFVKQHEKEIDVWVRSFFDYWNKIGKLNHDEKVSNKMQEIFLVSIVRILFEKSGMPKKTQKEVMQKLVDSL